MHVSEHFDFRDLDDPAFLAERARVRVQIEHSAGESADRSHLTRLYAAMNEEFCRRARIRSTQAR
jgi:hypothetical protein